MVDPDVTEQLLQALLPSNGSVAATASSHPEESEPTTTNGIIPGMIAAAVFIALLLSLYTVLWKCMLSPPPRCRKQSKMRVRVQQRSLV